MPNSKTRSLISFWLFEMIFLNPSASRFHVIPAPYQVRGKLQPESSVFHGVANTLDPGFHRGDEYSAIFSHLQGDEGGFEF